MGVPSGGPATDLCSSCEGSGKRTIAELAVRFLSVVSLPLVLAVDIALLFVVPDSWALKSYLYGIAIICGLLFLLLIEALAVPCFLRLADLAFGLCGERGRVCADCKGFGRREAVRPEPVKRWLKVLLVGSAILAVVVLALCLLVAKGYIPI